MKNLRQILRDGGSVVGSWINTASPITAELMSGCGFDYLVVDAEHSAVNVPQAQTLFQAIAAGNSECVPLVRLPGNDYAITKRYLDAGAMGVIAPLINTPEQAVMLVRSVKYPPDGDRGVGFARCNGYGAKFDEYISRANDEMFVCVQIEHIRAIENLDAILSVEGIDAAFIGPYDLTASMEIAAQFEHPKFIKAMKLFVDACESNNVTAGIHVVQPNANEAITRVKEGYRMIAYSLDITMLNKACRDGLGKIREGLQG